METIQGKYLKELVDSTQDYINTLKKINHESHYYQVRLSENNDYVGRDIKTTIDLLSEKLHNYKSTLKLYQSNDEK